MMPVKNLIYLIGFMGSGKSTAGKKLAALLGWSFIDLDKKVEEHTKKTISDIFLQDGEEYFRQIETQMLGSLMSLGKTVIATGGGTPCHGDNMDQMLNSGLTIYLKLTPRQLQRRLLASSDERPLIKNMDKSQLLAFIEKKLASREHWYNRAEIILDGINLDINSLLKIVRNRSG
jgi:shikimate kinase